MSEESHIKINSQIIADRIIRDLDTKEIPFVGKITGGFVINGIYTNIKIHVYYNFSISDLIIRNMFVSVTGEFDSKPIKLDYNSLSIIYYLRKKLKIRLR